MLFIIIMFTITILGECMCFQNLNQSMHFKHTTRLVPPTTPNFPQMHSIKKIIKDHCINQVTDWENTVNWFNWFNTTMSNPLTTCLFRISMSKSLHSSVREQILPQRFTTPPACSLNADVYQLSCCLLTLPHNEGQEPFSVCYTIIFDAPKSRWQSQLPIMWLQYMTMSVS